jgi:FAD/FMN-containing dehydrogenase
MTERAGPSASTTRRAFLGGALATVAVGAFTPKRLLRLSFVADATEPFPTSIPLYRQGFVNWAKDIVIEQVPTCAPRDAQEVLQVANWAARNGHRVRARGAMHTWAPLVTAAGADAKKVVLVDTSHLASISVRPNSAGAVVTAGTGATMDAVLAELERAGFGFVATPAPGDVTIGGVLAIDGHGTAIPAAGEAKPRGATYGSLSNLVVSLTALVWDRAGSKFRLQTFTRDDPKIRPFLTSLGRTFITEVSLQATANSRLRCLSIMDVPWTELFAAPGTNGRTFASYLDQAGRVETIWFPFTDTPWLKVWSVAPTRPSTAREVTAPYNYAFSEIPEATADGLKAATIADPAQAKGLGQLAYSTVAAGLVSAGSTDIWGWSKNLLLYVRPSTLRYSANGYAISTTRRNVQRVVHDFTDFYHRAVQRYAAKGHYPANGPVEIRVTGLDQPMRGTGPSAGAPLLSAVRPRPDHPEWDVAVWLDILSFTGTPHGNDLMRETERWLLASQRRWSALVRPEWSKGWGYGRGGPWQDEEFIGHTIPQSFTRGAPENESWRATVGALAAHDPKRVFTDRLLNRLMPD